MDKNREIKEKSSSESLRITNEVKRRSLELQEGELKRQLREKREKLDEVDTLQRSWKKSRKKLSKIKTDNSRLLEGINESKVGKKRIEDSNSKIKTILEYLNDKTSIDRFALLKGNKVKNIIKDDKILKELINKERKFLDKEKDIIDKDEKFIKHVQKQHNQLLEHITNTSKDIQQNINERGIEIQVNWDDYFSKRILSDKIVDQQEYKEKISKFKEKDQKMPDLLKSQNEEVGKLSEEMENTSFYKLYLLNFSAKNTMTKVKSIIEESIRAREKPEEDRKKYISKKLEEYDQESDNEKEVYNA